MTNSRMDGRRRSRAQCARASTQDATRSAPAAPTNLPRAREPATTLESIRGAALQKACALRRAGRAWTVRQRRRRRSAPFRFALTGEGLWCGYDDGTPVVDLYESPLTFTGTIHEAVIHASGTPVVDLVADCDERG